MASKKVEPRFVYPRVGIAVIVVRAGLVLMGQRKGAYANGQWSFPGGKLELGESWEGCAKRELQEETGLRIQMASEPVGMSNDIWSGQRHYVTIYMIGRSKTGAAKVMEPTKCATWGWFHPDALPIPLFLPIHNFLKHDPGFNKSIARAMALPE
jgi:8-oxo-dGTP diphosphatase